MAAFLHSLAAETAYLRPMGCACSKGDPSAASAPAADARVMAGDDKDKDDAAGEIQEKDQLAADLQDIEWLEGEAPAEEQPPEEEDTTVRTATKRRTLIWQLRLAREAAQKREHKTNASPELNPVGTVVDAVVNLSHRVFGRESPSPDSSPDAPAGATKPTKPKPTRRGEVDETDEAGADAAEGGDSGVESGEEGYADGGDGGGAEGGVADGAGASSRRHRSRRVDWRLRVAREAQQQRQISHRQRLDSNETLGADASPKLPATVEEGGVSPQYAGGSAGLGAVLGGTELGGADSGNMYDGVDEAEAPISAPVNGVNGVNEGEAPSSAPEDGADEGEAPNSARPMGMPTAEVDPRVGEIRSPQAYPYPPSAKEKYEPADGNEPAN